MHQKENRHPHIVVISGSVRPGNYTGKATTLVLEELEKQGIPFEWVDPARLQLPLPGLDSGTASVESLKRQVASATGVIFVTPEYHGSFSSVIKRIIENLGFPSELSGKPVALLGVAASRIGAIKSREHLRGVCSHVGALVLPSLVSIARVRDIFDDEGNCRDEAAERRIRSVATTLVDYIRGYICPRVTLERMVREEGA